MKTFTTYRPTVNVMRTSTDEINRLGWGADFVKTYSEFMDLRMRVQFSEGCEPRLTKYLRLLDTCLENGEMFPVSIETDSINNVFELCQSGEECWIDRDCVTYSEKNLFAHSMMSGDLIHDVENNEMYLVGMNSLVKINKLNK